MLGVSKTGYNGEFIGLTKDGKLVVNETTTNKLDANFIKAQVIESINTNSKYFKITTDGATFGDMSSGEYTKVGQHGLEHVDANGSKPYLYVTKMQQFQLHQSTGDDDYITQYCRFNNTIKTLLNGKTPQVFLCNTSFGESSAISSGTAEIVSIDAEGFSVKFKVWEYLPKAYKVYGSDDITCYFETKKGGYFDFDALIIG